MKNKGKVFLLMFIFFSLNFTVSQSSADVTAYDITIRFTESYIFADMLDDLGTPMDIHFKYWSNRVSGTSAVDVGNCYTGFNGVCNHGDYVLSTRVIHGDVVSIKMYDEDLISADDHLLTVQIEFLGETANGADTPLYWTPLVADGWIQIAPAIRMRTIYQSSFGQGETETWCSPNGVGAVPCRTVVVSDLVWYHTTSHFKVKSSLYVPPPPSGGGGGGVRNLCSFRC